MPEEVAGRLTRARIQLALNHPFLATAVMRLPFREAGATSMVSTMATDGYHIFFSSDWVGTLSHDELVGVIAHEVLHVVFGHSDRMGPRHPGVWNAACDHAINVLLKMDNFTIPAGGLADRSFLGLTAEEIYDRLTSGAGHSLDLAAAALCAIGKDLLDPADIRVVNLRDADALDEEGRRQLRRVLAGEMRPQLHGALAGFFAQELGVAHSRRLDWTQLLRDWLTSKVGADWTTYPFAKKHLHRGLYMPSNRVMSPDHLIFAIDTSGSMDEESLASIFGEIRSLRETFPARLTVIQADAEIQEVKEYDTEETCEFPTVINVLGRGGTDFRPVFEFVAEAQDEPTSVLIYATDGYGTFPATEPLVSTLWVLTATGIDDAEIPFGSTVRLPAIRRDRT